MPKVIQVVPFILFSPLRNLHEFLFYPLRATWPACYSTLEFSPDNFRREMKLMKLLIMHYYPVIIYSLPLKPSTFLSTLRNTPTLLVLPVNWVYSDVLRVHLKIICHGLIYMECIKIWCPNFNRYWGVYKYNKDLLSSNCMSETRPCSSTERPIRSKVGNRTKPPVFWEKKYISYQFKADV